MEKICNVVMLPTENKQASILLTTKDNKIRLSPNEHFGNDGTTKYQHLYITSDERIKEGDWYIDKRVVSNPVISNTPMHQDKIFACKKIIATTNKSLTIMEDYKGEVNVVQILPQISESFIKAYVEAQGNIKEVLVEYERRTLTERGVFERKLLEESNSPYPKDIPENWYTWVIKTRPDNTIIIHQVNTYSEEDLEKAFNAGRLRSKNSIRYNYPFTFNSFLEGKCFNSDRDKIDAEEEYKLTEANTKTKTYTRDEVLKLCKIAWYNETISKNINFNKWIEENL